MPYLLYLNSLLLLLLLLHHAPPPSISGSLFALQFAIYKVIPSAPTPVAVVVVDAAPARFSFRLMVARTRPFVSFSRHIFIIIARVYPAQVRQTNWPEHAACH